MTACQKDFFDNDKLTGPMLPSEHGAGESVKKEK